MRQLVITGYASLDFAVRLDGMAQGDRTTLIRSRDPLAWPRPGGCPTYIAGAASRAGQQAAPIMWVGKGSEGAGFIAALKAQGLETKGIGIVDAPRSPTALMVYQSDRSCICLYDPALNRSEVLTGAQRKLIQRATHLCISVGPPHLMEEILACCPVGARLYWAVKNDQDAFPEPLQQRLSASADVIFFSASERGLIGPTSAILVETRGGDGVVIGARGEKLQFEVDRIECQDTTGAGDTFAGGFIAADMAGAGPGEAARAGIAAAAALLGKRTERDNP